MDELIEFQIDSRFNGPPNSGNGGYVAGKIAELVGLPCEVTLRKPPPLDKTLILRLIDKVGEVFSGDSLIATVASSSPVKNNLELIDYESAKLAAISGLQRRIKSNIFSTCFVCGPDRKEGDGLRLFADTPPSCLIDGNLKPVAVAWKPSAKLSSNGETIDEAYIWAAMDCPSAVAINNTGDETPEQIACLLGRFRNTVFRRPEIDEHCVVVAQMTHRDRRKIFCDVSLFGGRGDLLAAGHTTWIALEDIFAFEAS